MELYHEGKLYSCLLTFVWVHLCTFMCLIMHHVMHFIMLSMHHFITCSAWEWEGSCWSKLRWRFIHTCIGFNFCGLLRILTFPESIQPLPCCLQMLLSFESYNMCIKYRGWIETRYCMFTLIFQHFPCHPFVVIG